MHRDTVIQEFAHQSRTLERASAFRSAQTLGSLLDLVPPAPGGSWLEAACGTGVVARALAPKVGEVVGVDLVQAMVAVARRQSRAAGLANVRFEIGDAAALRFADATFDGALTRFSLHHIPLPGRVISELARVVRPGGWIIVADHVTDDDADAAAWHQEIERLRDPSHWSCLTPARIRALGARAGLELDYERCLGIAVDFDDWLRRSTAGTEAASLIEACVRDRPADAGSFEVFDAGGRRQIGLRYLLTRWRRP